MIIPTRDRSATKSLIYHTANQFIKENKRLIIEKLNNELNIRQNAFIIVGFPQYDPQKTNRFLAILHEGLLVKRLEHV